MSRREGLTFISLDTFSVSGMSTATAAVLLIKAEIAATTLISPKSRRCSLLPASRTSRRPIALTAPVRWSPALRMNIAPTVIVAGLEKPATPSDAFSTPPITSATMTRIATRSTRTFSVTSMTMVSRRMPATKRMSVFISSAALSEGPENRDKKGSRAPQQQGQRRADAGKIQKAVAPDPADHGVGLAADEGHYPPINLTDITTESTQNTEESMQRFAPSDSIPQHQHRNWFFPTIQYPLSHTPLPPHHRKVQPE